MHIIFRKHSFLYLCIFRASDLDLERALRKTYEFLVSVCKLEFVTEKSVKWAFGVLQTNSVGLANGRGLYPIVSIMSHSCVPSLCPMVKPGEAMAFKTNRVISEGEELSIRYQFFFILKRYFGPCK